MSVGEQRPLFVRSVGRLPRDGLGPTSNLESMVRAIRGLVGVLSVGILRVVYLDIFGVA